MDYRQNGFAFNGFKMLLVQIVNASVEHIHFWLSQKYPLVGTNNIPATAR